MGPANCSTENRVACGLGGKHDYSAVLGGQALKEQFARLKPSVNDQVRHVFNPKKEGANVAPSAVKFKR